MKNLISKLKTTGLSILTVASLVTTITLPTPVHALGWNTTDYFNDTPGSACQAYDEGAILANTLTRSTWGISNIGESEISIYCPLDTGDINVAGDNELWVRVNYEVDNPSSSNSSRFISWFPNNITCWAATANGKHRSYHRFNQEGNGVTSARSNSFKKRYGTSVMVKCDLQPGQRILNFTVYTER